jgi:hypothetical protein
MLRPNLADHPVSDFQHWPPRRPPVVATATELARFTGPLPLSRRRPRPALTWSRYWLAWCHPRAALNGTEGLRRPVNPSAGRAEHGRRDPCGERQPLIML